MQTVEGDDAKGLCKEEFQAFMKYFVRPLVERAVRWRLREENQLAVTPTYTVRRLSDRGGGGIGEANGVEQTLQEICDYWKAELNGAYVALLNKMWHPHTHATGGAVPLAAYKPTCWREKRSEDSAYIVPFFVTLDNHGVHSFYLSDDDGNIVGHEQQPGVPLLQLPTMPPQGHDAHQVVEHAIGTIKSHVTSELARAMRDNNALTCKLLHEAVLDGADLFDKSSLAKNLIRLRRCMRVVAAHEGVKVTWIEQNVWCHGMPMDGDQERYAMGTAGGFPPATLA